MTVANGTHRSCVVLDIDGVLADVRHRLAHLSSNPKDWDAFFAAAAGDPAIPAGIEFAHTAASTHLVVYLTGRPERIRVTTQYWLDRHELPAGRLLMRADADHRPATIVKLQHLRELAAEIEIDLVVDDDPLVVGAARRARFNARLTDWLPGEPERSPANGERLRSAQEVDGRT